MHSNLVIFSRSSAWRIFDVDWLSVSKLIFSTSSSFSPILCLCLYGISIIPNRIYARLKEEEERNTPATNKQAFSIYFQYQIRAVAFTNQIGFSFNRQMIKIRITAIDSFEWLIGAAGTESGQYCFPFLYEQFLRQTSAGAYFYAWNLICKSTIYLHFGYLCVLFSILFIFFFHSQSTDHHEITTICLLQN